MKLNRFCKKYCELGNPEPVFVLLYNNMSGMTCYCRLKFVHFDVSYSTTELEFMGFAFTSPPLSTYTALYLNEYRELYEGQYYIVLHWYSLRLDYNQPLTALREVYVLFFYLCTADIEDYSDRI